MATLHTPGEIGVPEQAERNPDGKQERNPGREPERDTSREQGRAGAEQADPASSDGRRFRIRWLLLGTAVLAGAGVTSWIAVQDDAARSADAAVPPPHATAEITRETVAATRSFDGTLGHGEGFTVVAAGQGTVTRSAVQNVEVTRGTELYRLNEQPVTAMFGAIPMYRDLREGSAGVDVAQLEANLEALGYGGFTVDDEFTAATATAVRAWQSDISAPETGAVARGDVVFLPEGGLVDTAHVKVGASVNPGSAVLDVTSSSQLVSLDAEIADRDLLAGGARVTVTLPGGAEVAGTVSAASVKRAPPEADGAGLGGADAGADSAVVEVEIRLESEVEAALMGSPVDVVVESDRREDVLVVPVKALLATAGGGYGLEVVADDGTTSVVPAEPGLFADGRVEVTGDGLAEGMVVGVAGR